MRANQFIALTFLTTLVSLSVFTSNQNTSSSISSVESTKNRTSDDLLLLYKFEVIDSLILSQAIKSVKDQPLKRQLLRFKHECEMSISGFEILLHKLGLEIPNRNKNVTSYWMQGFVAIRGLTGDQGILKALRANEKKVMSVYENALKGDLPKDARPIVQNVFDDVSRHIQYLEDKLRTKTI